MDVIEVCCEWYEYPSCRKAVQSIYSMEMDTEEEAREALEQTHGVLVFDGGVIVSTW